MFKIIYKPTHNDPPVGIDVKERWDRDSIIETLSEQGSLIMGVGFHV